MDEKPRQKILYVRVVGVTQNNRDGSSRQDILAMCKNNDPVKLVREKRNAVNKNAIAVLHNNKMIGYLQNSPLLASHLDKGGEAKAKIHSVTGGTTFLQKLLGKKGRSYRCVIKIKQEIIDWNKINTYMNKNVLILETLRLALAQEKYSLEEAADIYRRAIDQIVLMDSYDDSSGAWRTAKLPIERLSLLYEKLGRIHDCFRLLTWYEKYDDVRGLPETEKESIRRRKQRIIRKYALDKKKEGESALADAIRPLS